MLQGPSTEQTGCSSFHAGVHQRLSFCQRMEFVKSATTCPLEKFRNIIVLYGVQKCSRGYNQGRAIILYTYGAVITIVLGKYGVNVYSTAVANILISRSQNSRTYQNSSRFPPSPRIYYVVSLLILLFQYCTMIRLCCVVAAASLVGTHLNHDITLSMRADHLTDGVFVLAQNEVRSSLESLMLKPMSPETACFASIACPFMS